MALKKREDEDPSAIIALSKGDKKAFEQIFHQFYTDLCYHAQKIVLDHEIAKDIVSDLFIKVWVKPKAFKSKSYLFTSVHNAALDHKKWVNSAEKYINNTSYQMYQEELDDLISARIFETEKLKALFKAIENLPTQCRKVMQMTLDGMKTDEIAQELGCAEQTVRNTRIRAINMLKSEWRRIAKRH